jgi:TolB-like protein/DNA-binding winged helix-turn-helix (wHTH) protein/Flp pilus assembly protein TadD
MSESEEVLVVSGLGATLAVLECLAMSETVPICSVVRFGVFEVDLRKGELRKSGLKLRLTGQPFQVLAILLEHPGEVVTRDELRKRLWTDDTFVDFDHGLNAVVNRLREALGESPDSPHFIETIPRQGYRFIAVVDGRRDGNPPAPVTLTSQPDDAPRHKPHGRTSTLRRSKYFWTVGLVTTLIFAILIVSNLTSLRHWLLGRHHAPSISSIAVLPLDNLSGDSGQQYFADGITDALITELGKVSSLRVISRQSVMRYKGSSKSSPQIARELGVEALIEGSVVRDGHRVAVSANLIDALNEEHIWAERYDRDLGDILTVQSDFAQAIAREVQAKLTPSERARFGNRHVVNADAYEQYLKGQYFAAKGTEEGRRKAVRYFEQAIEIDPNDALAYAGIAQAYAPLGYYGFVSPIESDNKTVWAATKALELDDTLSEAHASLGLARSVHEWDWSTGERELQRAIELNPGNAGAHALYAQILMMTGRTQESDAESNQARKLDPLSPILYAFWAERLIWTGQYDQAIEQCQKAIELDPTYPVAHLRSGVAYEAKGELEKAITELESARDLSGGAPYFLRSLGHAYATAGRKDQAQQIIRELRQDSTTRYVSPFAFALIYTGLGEKEQAFDWLDKAYRQRDPSLSTIRGDSRLDPLRGDPRFQDLLRRVRLAP